jgi:hypothetical protein
MTECLAVGKVMLTSFHIIHTKETNGLEYTPTKIYKVWNSNKYLYGMKVNNGNY